MNLSIDLSQYETVKESIDAAQEFLLGHGFTVIRHADRYFDFMKDDKFGHFTIDTSEMRGYNLTSVWKPSRENGTGARMQEEPEFKFSIDAFKGTLNCRPSWIRGTPVFYRDLHDFVSNSYWKNKGLIVHTPGDSS